MSIYIRSRKARKAIRGNRRMNPKVLAICFFSAAGLLLTAALYVFLLHQPSQPDEPAEMALALPVITPSPSPTVIKTPIATTEPIVSPKPLIIQDSFKELYEQNSDIVGWIKVNGTDVDYPIMQSDDNNFYMEKDFDKQYSYPGSIFLDFRCDVRNMYMSAHQILYGHNMKNGTMFQQLTKYQDEEFFKDNRYININTLYGNYVFEVFSAYETPISFYYLETDFSDNDKWLEFIEELQKKSDFETDIAMSPNDVVLTLSTCTNRHNDNYRYVVHARLTNPEKYDMVYDYVYE